MAIRRDKPKMRMQSGAETDWEIFLVQVMLFTRLSELDDDTRDSGKLAFQNFALFFVVLYFLVTDPSEYTIIRGNICMWYVPLACSALGARDPRMRRYMGACPRK
jgi:hypothetical protein